MFKLKGSVCIVTGGSSGIGLATVKLLLSVGAKVAFCGRDLEKLAKVTNTLNANEDNFLAIKCDVLNVGEVGHLIDSAVTKWGKIDHVICNAGQAHVGHLDDIKEEVWLAEVQLKLFSVLNIVKAAKPYLVESAAPSITCVNSLLSIQPEPHMIATSAARAYLLNFTHNLSHEYIPFGIRVNSILVGMIDSGQWKKRYELRENLALSYEEWTAQIAQKRGIPMARLGTPEEAAYALIFLASPLASYTTGSCIDVSGGFAKQI